MLRTWNRNITWQICPSRIIYKNAREASILSSLKPLPGSKVNSTRLGRGPGNKKGKTAGRGTKGQNSRAGGGNAYFEGGQTPLHIRFPKIGHNTSYYASLTKCELCWFNRRRLKLMPVNLDSIQIAIDDGYIDPNRPITMKTLREAKLVNKIGDGVKLLARVFSISGNDHLSIGKRRVIATNYHLRLTRIQRSHPNNWK